MGQGDRKVEGLGVTIASEPMQRLIADGNALEDSGDCEGARQLYEEAALIAPASPRPWLNLGNVLQRQGRPRDAIAATERAIALAPDFAPAHFNLGNLHAAALQSAAAERAYRKALHLAPAFTDAAVALAGILESSGRSGDAEIVLREAIAADSMRSGPMYNLALLLMARDACDEAEVMLLRAFAVEPTFMRTCVALGSLCLRLGRAVEAEAWLRRVPPEDPSFAEAACALLFSLNARDDLDPRHVYNVHREIAQRLATGVRPAEEALHRAGPHERLRIGYLSPDFRQHAVALFVAPVLRHHDRRLFDIYCYYCHKAEDSVTRELKGLADHWRPIAGLDDEAAAQLIRDDEIDVLVDLAGYTDCSRVLLMVRRCAPVQATWLGYLHSTGLDGVDYRICDNHTDPPGVADNINSERRIRMPASQWCYEPLHQAAAPADPTVSTAQVVFGSFNQFWKVSRSCLELWLEVLRRVPAATMRVTGVPSGRTAEDLLERITRAGVSADRVAFSPRVDIQAYFAAIAGVDVALDTTPYNGATTSLDTLWMGVPFIALTGDRPAARSGTSILRTLGMPELIAATPEEYVTLNVRLANDGVWRGALRATLRQRLAQSPLMDSATFTRALEARLCEAHDMARNPR
jgi:predicted O-linked N-acetylglucosamine transferase (SPINDLY family)